MKTINENYEITAFNHPLPYSTEGKVRNILTVLSCNYGADHDIPCNLMRFRVPKMSLNNTCCQYDGVKST